MGDISASVPQQQLPDYIGTLSTAAQIQPRNALLQATAQSTHEDYREKAYAFTANAIGSALYPISGAPPEQQEGLYQSAKQQLKATGIDTSSMPDNYDPQYVSSTLSRALGIAQSYEMKMRGAVVGALGGGRVNIPPPPGSMPAPAAPTAAPQPAAAPPANALNAAPAPPPAVPAPPATTPQISQPDQAPPNVPRGTNALNAPQGVPGAGPAMAFSYLMDPAAAAGEIKAQMDPQLIRPGSVYRNPGTGTEFQVPELPPGVSYDPETGTASATPGAAAATEEIKRQEGLGTKRGEVGGDYEQEVRTDAAGAVTHNALLDQMKSQLAGVTSFDPGTYGSLKGKASKLFASVLGDNDSATNFQEFQKNSIQLALQQARSLSPREAFQGVLFVQQGNPNFDMTRAGINGVIGQMQGLDQYKMAKMQALNNWGGDPNKFESYWQKATDPTVFMFANASPAQQQQMLGGLTKPEKIQFLQTYRNTRDNGWLTQTPPQQ